MANQQGIGQTWGAGTIGNWTQSDLIRFIREYQEQQPPSFFDKLRINQLQVESILNLKPSSIVLLTANNFVNVGDTGAPAFQNGWVAYGSSYGKVGYWKDPFGFVHLKGLAKSGTINTNIFTLPPGYRPYERKRYMAVSNGAVGILDVLTDGSVLPVTGNNTYFQLDGLYWPTTNVNT